MFVENSGILGDSSQLGSMDAAALQHQLGDLADAANNAIPRGGQNPMPGSGDVNSGRTARNSDAAGSSDSASDINASRNTPAVNDAKKLAGCDPCPEDDIARGLYNFGLWREAQANELKYSQGRVRRSYETYSDGLDTSAGPIPLASGEDITGVVAIVVDHPDIFVFATSKLFHLKAPLLRYDDGVDTWYRWTLSESKNRFQVGEGGPAQGGSGLRSVAGQAFYDAVDKIVTSIPGVPYAATGSGRISTFKLVDGVLVDGVSSIFTRHASQGLAGASMHKKHLVSFCADRWSGLYPTDLSNDGKILGLVRVGDSWDNDWEVEVLSLVPTDWQVLTFPGVHYNFSPPYYRGYFWSTLSAFLEDRTASPEPGTGVFLGTLEPFHSKLIDVGIGIGGESVAYDIGEWSKPADLNDCWLHSLIDPLDDFARDFFFSDFAPSQAPPEGTWDVWQQGIATPTINPLGVYLDSDWGEPTGLYDPTTDGYAIIGTHTNSWVWLEPTTDARDVLGETWSDLRDLWNGKPIPLPADFAAPQYVSLFHTEAYSPASSIETAYGLYHGQWYLTQGHESCRVALPDGRSWQAALYPAPLVVPSAIPNTSRSPRISGDAEGATTAPPIGVNTEWFFIGAQDLYITTRYETYLIYSPSPGSYVEVPIGNSFAGAKFRARLDADVLDLTTSEVLPVPEMVWQLLPVDSLGILLVLRSDRDALVTSYPIVEARSIYDPATVLWTYEDLISRDTLTSDVVTSGASPTVKFGAGETEWTLGTIPQNTVNLRPVMKLVREPKRHVLLISTECFKKQLSTSDIPTRVEFRCLEISADGFTEIENITSEQTASSFLADARGMNYTPDVPIPRPRQLAAMAIADDVTYYNYDTFLRMNDPGDIDDGVLPP